MKIIEKIKEIIADQRSTFLLTISASLFLVAASWFLIRYLDQSNITEQANDLSSAISMFDQGKKDEAIKSLELFHKENPEDKAIRDRLAYFYFQNKNYDQFLEYFKEEKLDSAILNNMAASIYKDKGDNEKAIEFYNLAIKASPQNYSTYVSLAAFYQGADDLSKALETVKQGIDQCPKSTQLRIAVASYSLKLNDKKSARLYLQAALEIDANNAQAKQMLASL